MLVDVCCASNLASISGREILMRLYDRKKGNLMVAGMQVALDLSLTDRRLPVGGRFCW